MESFSSLAAKRRSHRKFTDTKVSADEIKAILRAALMSPSAKGLRKWHFVVTEDKAKIAALSGIRTHGSQFLADAPLAIAVLGEPAEQEMWIEDGSIAAVSMQYQAEDLGIGTCWCQIRGRQSIQDGVSAETRVREILGIPEKYSVLCLLGAGHPADERQIQDEASLKWAQVHYEQF